MNTISLHKIPDFKRAKIELPSSKSLSNRALIIQALCAEPIELKDLSSSSDTQNLIELLKKETYLYDVGPAGTNMRFLISLLSIKPGIFVITGSERMLQRPVGKLVDCLNLLGADIHYLKEEGYPPLEIHGKKLMGAKVNLDGSTSSQFISSLLMIAPMIENGLIIELQGTLVSRPYIEMTLALMYHFGITSVWDNNTINILPQPYLPANYTVEKDWSAAAFWYGHIACGKTGDQILLQQLSFESLQGDKNAAQYYSKLGVQSTQTPEGILIEKTNRSIPDQVLEFDLMNEPDLFPALAFSCATLRLKARFTGLDTLQLKESNRIDAIKTELEKTGTDCITTNKSFEIKGFHSWPQEIHFNTYNDHRIAMASSICVQSNQQISILEPEVIDKSYPEFWNQLSKTTHIK
jgi:3-phosphoshikimate 1-carboxyvinyltransferase